MKKTKNTKNFTRAMVEASLMIAFATVLSLFKLVEMPYGGSITPASMLPILIVSYRHGTGMGLFSGLVFAVIQQLLGLNNLTYVTGWASVLAVIVLDYVLAFALVGLCGCFRDKFLSDKSLSKSARQRLELSTGMALACVLRYIMHVISGATVWAGLSIPTEAALVYSLGYNATYMLPETIISVLVTAWIGAIVDFSRDTPITFASYSDRAQVGIRAYLPSLAMLSLFATVIAEVLIVCPHLQSPDDGKFTLELLGNVNLVAFTVVGACGLAFTLALWVAHSIMKKSRG